MQEMACHKTNLNIEGPASWHYNFIPSKISFTVPSNLSKTHKNLVTKPTSSLDVHTQCPGVLNATN